MKKNSINYKGSGLIMFAIMLLCTLFGVTGAETMFAVGAAPGAATALGSPEGEGECRLCPRAFGRRRAVAQAHADHADRRRRPAGRSVVAERIRREDRPHQ